jgi:hypothetical protein
MEGTVEMGRDGMEGMAQHSDIVEMGREGRQGTAR